MGRRSLKLFSNVLNSLPVNQEEERIDKEERYERSQDSIEQINKKIDRLTGVTGELTGVTRDLVTAIRGNDLGTPGLAAQFKDLKTDVRKSWERQNDIEDEIAQLKIQVGGRDMKTNIIWGLACSLGTAVLFIIGQYFKK